MTPPSTWMTETLGWAATAVFVGSYFFARPEILVRVQMLGAVMWVAYGVAMRAPPVVVANVLVLGAAAWKARRSVDPDGAGARPDALTRREG